MGDAALHALFAGKGSTTSLFATLTLKTAVLISIAFSVIVATKASIVSVGSVEGVVAVAAAAAAAASRVGGVGLLRCPFVGVCSHIHRDLYCRNRPPGMSERETRATDNNVGGADEELKHESVVEGGRGEDKRESFRLRDWALSPKLCRFASLDPMSFDRTGQQENVRVPRAFGLGPGLGPGLVSDETAVLHPAAVRVCVRSTWLFQQRGIVDSRMMSKVCDEGEAQRWWCPPHPHQNSLRMSRSVCLREDSRPARLAKLVHPLK